MASAITAGCSRQSRSKAEAGAAYDPLYRFPVCRAHGRLRVYVTLPPLRLLAALAGIFLITACGTLPRPFQPEEKAPPGALEAALGARAGVFVEAISGLPAPQSEKLTAELVRALHARDVAAGRQASNRASYRISARQSDSGRLLWFLAAPGGTIVLQFEEQVAPGDGGDGAGDGASVNRVAAAAVRFAAYFNPPEAALEVRATPVNLTLSVLPVDGAPGDGHASLSRAMRRALAAHGLESTKMLENADFVVLGSVYVADMTDSNDQQSIAVDWTVMSPDGKRIGTVNQSNTIAKGTLDGAWGPVAHAVAGNGADGIIAMLERVGAIDRAAK